MGFSTTETHRCATPRYSIMSGIQIVFSVELLTQLIATNQGQLVHRNRQHPHSRQSSILSTIHIAQHQAYKLQCSIVLETFTSLLLAG